MELISVGVGTGSVRCGNIGDTSESGGVGIISGISGWEAAVGRVGVIADSSDGCGTIGVPFGVNTVNVVILLSSFLVLDLHGDNAGSQSHQNQEALCMDNWIQPLEISFSILQLFYI